MCPSVQTFGSPLPPLVWLMHDSYNYLNRDPKLPPCLDSQSPISVSAGIY